MSNFTRQSGRCTLLRQWAGALLCSALLCGLHSAAAQDSSRVVVAQGAPAWRLQTVFSRTTPAGKRVSLPMAVAAPSERAPRQVLLYLSSLPVAHIGRDADTGAVRMAASAPWIVAAPALNAQGVVLAVLDPPSDAAQRSLARRPVPDISADIGAAMRQLNADFPGLPVHLAGFGPDAGELITASAVLPSLGRLVFASGDFRSYRTNDWRTLVRPVLMVNAPAAQCDLTSYTDAAYVARRNGFKLVAAGYRQQERTSVCGPGSQTALAGLEADLAALLVQWLDDAPLPAIMGYTDVQLAWREQVMRYPVPNSTGANWRELSVLYPPGDGPFPVLVFNHGDVSSDSPYVKFRQRMVDMVVAREFLNLGMAVAFPARMGVGLSDGLYGNELVHDDFNPTYKAQVHAQEIVPALEYLRRLPLLDMRRVVLGGQSAGGYAVMQMAGMRLPGVLGVINFSGGRTDAYSRTYQSTLTETSSTRETKGRNPLSSVEKETVTTTRIQRTEDLVASQLNQVMVDGFAEFGKASRVPGLWVFAENDSRYSANTIRESYKAFTQAGGQATLLLHPPLEEDGHAIYHRPELWRATLRKYLQGVGVVAGN